MFCSMEYYTNTKENALMNLQRVKMAKLTELRKNIFICLLTLWIPKRPWRPAMQNTTTPEGAQSEKGHIPSPFHRG